MEVFVPALPESFLHRVRSLGIDDLGQPVRHLVAEGGEPCRDVLRRARPGERLILGSFSPFWTAGPFREYGAVHVLEEGSDEVVPRDRLPLEAGEAGSGEATDYLVGQFVLRAYGVEQVIVGGEVVRAAEAVEAAERLLGRADVAFVDARFAVYGCFACRIERSAGAQEVDFRYSEPVTAPAGVAA